MDCSCINLSFSFSFQLLGRIFTTKNEHLLAKIDYKGRGTPDAIQQRGSIFQFLKLTDKTANERKF
jgi:hypothetical protein